MEWAKLLSGRRWGQRVPAAARGNDAGEEFRSAFDRDYGRILYSSSFRRLQDKTQVFPLGRNDYVRTRLTHSLETAHIGGRLGKIVGEKILARDAALRERGLRPSHFGSVVASACLAPDIGNPPFGHFGETAIQAALGNARRRRRGPGDFPKKFEGNAQGFRLLTRTADSMAGKGLKLTAAVLGAFMKYPCSEKFSARKSGGISGKKFGFVEEDVPAARFVAAETGMLPCGNADGELAWKRHPLAFLTEAADDVSYLVADFEDAFVSKLISYASFREFLDPFISADERSRADSIAASEGAERAAQYVRAVAVGAGIRGICRGFGESGDAPPAGTQERALPGDSACAPALDALPDVSLATRQNAREVAEIELMGFRVIEALFGFFSGWIREPHSPKGEKIALMIGGNALAAASATERARFLLDYVSGMTDSFALATYRRLFGV